MPRWLAITLAANVLAGVVGIAGVRVNAGVPALAMLQRLNDGRWDVRLRDGSVQQICMGDRSRLIQLRHPGATCTQIVVEDSASSVTVQYTCRGRGYGRTHIRFETAQLVQIETQGIADGLPFEESGEGRRVGLCRP